MSIDNIQDGEAGVIVRGKLNDAIDKLNNTDTTVTEGSDELVTSGAVFEHTEDFVTEQEAADAAPIQDVIEGDNVTIDKTDPANPIISAVVGGTDDLIIRDNVPVSTDNTTNTFLKTYDLGVLGEYKFMEIRCLAQGPTQPLGMIFRIPGIGDIMARTVNNTRQYLGLRFMVVIDPVAEKLYGATANTEDDVGNNIALNFDFNPNQNYEMQIGLNTDGNLTTIHGVEIILKK